MNPGADRDEDPQRHSLKTVPERFLRGTHVLCAETDQGNCGTDVHDVGKKHACGVAVDPAAKQSHGIRGDGTSE